MDCGHNKVYFTNNEIDAYKKTVINKIYAALAIYEDCSSNNDLTPFHVYLNRIITEFEGVYEMFGAPTYITLSGILTGLYKKENPEHKEVKSIIFHCISTVKKAR